MTSVTRYAINSGSAIRTDRLQPLAHLHIQNGYREGSENRVINRPEAEAIVAKIVELCRDPNYRDKTMGVVGHLKETLRLDLLRTSCSTN